MRRFPAVPGLCLLVMLAILTGMTGRTGAPARSADAPKVDAIPDRSPCDIVLTADEEYLLTANRTSNSVSLVKLAIGKVVAEAAVGKRPAGIALTPDGKHVLVSGSYSGDLTVIAIDGDKLTKSGRVPLGFEPNGIAVAPDGKVAYVALTSAGAVAVVDLKGLKEVARITTGKWPRQLALSADGKRLAVGVSGDGGVAVIDTDKRERLYLEDFVGLNLGQMQISADGKYVYFPWIASRQMATTIGNIKEGWVLGSRLGRVRLDGRVRREAIALDPPGLAVADPHGLALSPDEKTLVASASGTHELLVFRMAGLPWQDFGGPGDHMNPQLLKDKDRFHRIELGGRPMAVRFAKDGKRVFVANYLSNDVQVVDLEGRKVTRTISLGGPKEPSLVRRGEAIFHDGRRSVDQWYSCHSCHHEGHAGAVTMDTRNDGRIGFAKTVPSLRHVTKTGPWNWHGWQKDLGDVVQKSFVDSMQGKRASDDDLNAMLAFLDTLAPPPNPYRDADGNPTEAAKRGEKVFQGAKAACARCHSGEYFTDGKIHNVGLGKPNDRYKGHNPPTLLGIYDRVLYLHDGRSRSLEDLLKGPHNPDKVTGNGDLTPDELRDLIEYLKSL